MIDEQYKNKDNIRHSFIKPVLRVIGTVLFVLLTALTSLLFFGGRYLLDNWAELSMDEIVYHLKSTLQGTSSEMIVDGLIRYGLPAALIIVAVIITWRILIKDKRKRMIYAICIVIAEICVLMALKSELDRKVGFSAYLIAQLSHDNSDFIGENYVDPNTVDLKFPDKKRNLIYIYLESTEITFADKENGGAFERNVIPELTTLAEENINFSGEEGVLNGAVSLPGTTWTSGAMFAQSTGLPLKVAINANRISKVEDFFPKIVAIGNILQKQGYRQELLIGSKEIFGGRGAFYTGHGNYEIRDYDYAMENGLIPDGYEVFWGYEDEKLFEFARNDLLEMAESGQPFNLTMLTVDSHFPDGYVCRLCKDEFGEQYANVFACTSRQVTSFISWIMEQSFYKDTTIVLCGDHPTMDGDFCENVPDDYQRKTYFCIINPGDNAQKADLTKWREYDTFDMFPTTLAAMDVEIPGNRLGMGVNLFSDEETLIEKFGVDTCTMQIMRPSSFMDSTSGFTITEKVLEKASSRAVIRKTEMDNGDIELILKGLFIHIAYPSIKNVEMELIDKETGESQFIETEFVRPNENDFNNYFHRVVFTEGDERLGGKSLDDFDIVYYISAGDIEHYRIADLEHNFEQN